VVLSLSPPSVRPTTGAAHGLAFGFGYSRRVGLLTIALPTFAGQSRLRKTGFRVAMHE
jgi:hypothetical protein